MTARIVVSCDGHRHGQPCRGALPTRSFLWSQAAQEATAAGWTLGGRGHLCPSRGHDEEHDRSP